MTQYIIAPEAIQDLTIIIVFKLEHLGFLVGAPQGESLRDRCCNS
ncbi:MAG: hypothetical protein QNJ33_05180 [Crocosphaera sp.]|nr:hypothetical protein [Crocosphaera sp.]